MKAIFSGLVRRANVDRRTDSPETPRRSKSVSPLSSSTATQPRATYSSFGTPNGGIGDAPAKPSYIAAESNHQGTGIAWESRFSSSPQGAAYGLRDLQQNGASTSNAHTGQSTFHPSHPPSSYKNPSKQVSSTSTTARGLVRKWSVASRRGTSSPNGSPSEHQPVISSAVSLLPSSGKASSHRVQPASRSWLQGAVEGSDDGHNTSPVAGTTHNDVAKADITVMTSEELAARLNELAVANADNLLTDDEYRALRQAVFDQMLRADRQSMAAPSDNGLTGFGSKCRDPQPDVLTAGKAWNGHSHLSADPLSVEAKRSGSSLGHDDPGATSIRSARSGKSSSFQSISQLFRHGSINSNAIDRQNSQDSHPGHHSFNRDTGSRGAPIRRDSSGLTSQLSSGDGHSQRASSLRTQQSSAAKSSRMSTFGRLRGGSQARREQAETAMREMEEVVSAERTARSLRAVSLYDAGSADFSQLGGAIHDKSTATSLRAEMAPTTMFGAEYADKSSSEIQAEMGVVQAEGNRMLSTFTALERTLLAKQTSMEATAVKGMIEAARSANPLACISSLAMPDRETHARRSARPPPPSSYRPPPVVNKLGGSLSHDSAYQLEETAVSAEHTAFETELVCIYAQKAAVVKRYQDRLAFLQSKLRSAAIREGLK